MSSPGTLLPRFAATLAVAAAALAVAAPGASADQKLPVLTKYTYKVELEGVQTTTWSYNHAADGSECDAPANGSGKERIVFHAKPKVMHTYDGLSQPTFFGKGKTAVFGMRLSGRVSRSGSVSSPGLPADADCPGGGDIEPTPPDCGSKTFSGLQYTPEYQYKSDRIVLERGSWMPDKYRYRNCPNMGEGFPSLIATNDDDSPIGRRLPYADLFKYGKNIVIARGKNTFKDDELSYTTRIRWTLSFKRLDKDVLNGK
jgi:hypothetical protein